MPSSYAAFCTRRSIRYEASVTRNEQRYATPPGRLVRVRALGRDVRRRQVVGPAHDVEQPDLELRRLRVGVERALVGQQRRPQAEHGPVALERQLAVHVVVAGEPGRDQVLGAVLDPLHRVAEQQRRRRGHHVAGVDRHLVAEPAADVGRDDPDLLLGQARHQREHRPDRVRRLRRHVDRRLAGGRVDVGDAAAGLERRRVAARVERVERDDHVGRGERRVGRRLVARLPVVDVVVRLAFLVGADHRGVRLQRLLRGGDRVERARSRRRSARARPWRCTGRSR